MSARASARIAPEQKATEEGASAVEYALLVAGIAAVIVVIVFALGTVLNNSVTKSCDHIKQTLNGTSDTCVSSP